MKHTENLSRKKKGENGGCGYSDESAAVLGNTRSVASALIKNLDNHHVYNKDDVSRFDEEVTTLTFFNARDPEKIGPKGAK